jgi:hypothetical protein
MDAAAMKESCTCGYNSGVCDYCKRTNKCQICHQTRNNKIYDEKLGMCTYCHFSLNKIWTNLHCSICNSEVSCMSGVDKIECKSCKEKGLGNQNQCTCGFEGQGIFCERCQSDLFDYYQNHWWKKLKKH